MLYTVRPWTLILVLVTVQALYPMHRDPDPPEKPTLGDHTKNFFAGKTRKRQTEPSQKEKGKDTELTKHQSQFFRQSTRPICYRQLETSHKPLTELQKKLNTTALRNAVNDNDIRHVQELLYEGTNPNAVNNVTGQTTLHIACLLGHHEMVKLLLDHPLIQLEAFDRHSQLPLVYAITENKGQCVGHLLDHGAWTGPDTQSCTAIHLAVECNKPSALVALLTHPINYLPPAQAVNVPTSLQSLCIKQVIKTHLYAQKSMRCDILSKLWGSPLAFNLHSDLCEDFAQHMDFAHARAFIATFSPDDHFKIARVLAWQYAKKHAETLTLLLSIINHNGHTPLHIAYAKHRPEVIQGLVHPTKYPAYLNVMLRMIPQLSNKLCDRPLAQDPVELFYHLFVYRLLGGTYHYD